MKHTPKELGSYLVYPNACIESRVIHGQWKDVRTIQPLDNGDGYLFVRLTINGKRKKWMLHKLMAELFLEPRPSKSHEIRHLDGNKKNNRIENLSWGTRKENAEDRERHGRTSRGLKHSNYIKNGIAKSKANANLIAAAAELYDLLDKINTAFYTRTSRKEWMDIMEQTKPLLRKARGE